MFTSPLPLNLSTFPLPLSIPISLLTLTLLTLFLTHTLTTLFYTHCLQSHSRPSSTPLRPPNLPYTIPILGSALSFLSRVPAQFYRHLLTTHPTSTGACTVVLGGRTAHLLLSPTAAQALFRKRETGLERFVQDVISKAFGMGKVDAARFFGDGEAGKVEAAWIFGDGEGGKEDDPRVVSNGQIWDDFLQGGKATRELGEVCEKLFERALDAQEEHGEKGLLDGVREGDGVEVDLYVLIRKTLFQASTATFFGERLGKLYEELEEDYFFFDAEMLTLYFGIPRFLAPKIYRTRAKLLAGLEAWHLSVLKECEGEVVHPDAVDWEPLYGSRANRARQMLYAQKGVSISGRACLDLGFMFGSSSNSIPLVAWILFHLLDPKANDKTLYSDVMAELATVVDLDDGSIDTTALGKLPLLQSIFYESLRLYVDSLVTRELTADTTLPVSYTTKKAISLRKGEMIIAPTYLAHHNPANWELSPDQFHGRRFLVTDPETEKLVFSTAHTRGALFPFGGGKGMCPGRAFAKHEVLASLALLLTRYDIEWAGWLKNGKPSNDFPQVAPSYPGAVVVQIGGDMRARMKKNMWKGTS